MGKYRKFTPEYREEAVQMVIATGRPIAEVAGELGINEGTLEREFLKKAAAYVGDRCQVPV